MTDAKDILKWLDESNLPRDWTTWTDTEKVLFKLQFGEHHHVISSDDKTLFTSRNFIIDDYYPTMKWARALSFLTTLLGPIAGWPNNEIYWESLDIQGGVDSQVTLSQDSPIGFKIDVFGFYDSKEEIKKYAIIGYCAENGISCDIT